ncbi:unnamed protein product [Rodentolepis nana]|uniref:G_PROTEIN_RECEP_F1_2 domain-containing protein n=1 Tax=Rodentolepis nana TaxID=102285 RepID=A0A0R3T0H5_RODNA|nr:unnamed protein product [Rodentolepis nana]
MNSAEQYNLSAYSNCPANEPVDYLILLQRYVVPILFGIVDVIGFTGNLLVIIVIAGYSTMRNSTNILILSLALADLSFIICCVPFTAVVYALEIWPLPDIFCKIYNFTTFLSAYCSVYTLVLMSLDRFLAVVFPLRSRLWRTTKNTVITLIIMWIILIAANLPIPITSRTFYWIEPDQEFGCKRRMCHISWMVQLADNDIPVNINQENSKLFYTIFFVLGYAFPLALICLFYSVLLKELLCGRVSKMSKSVEAHKGKRKATKLVIIVISVFAACWLPIQVIFMYQSFYSDSPTITFRVFHVMGNVLAYANSCVNPILYAFFSDSFRAGFASLICMDKSKMRDVRCESNADQTEMLSVRNYSNRKHVASEQEETLKNTNSNNRSMKKTHQKEVAFVESVCVHPLTQYPPECPENLIE